MWATGVLVTAYFIENAINLSSIYDFLQVRRWYCVCFCVKKCVHAAACICIYKENKLVYKYLQCVFAHKRMCTQVYLCIGVCTCVCHETDG